MVPERFTTGSKDLQNAAGGLEKQNESTRYIGASMKVEVIVIFSLQVLTSSCSFFFVGRVFQAEDVGFPEFCMRRPSAVRYAEPSLQQDPAVLAAAGRQILRVGCGRRTERLNSHTCERQRRPSQHYCSAEFVLLRISTL